MKGTLNKFNNSWVIEYKMTQDLIASDGGLIPIHPETLTNNIEFLNKNIRQEVNFEMKEICIGPATLDDDFKNLIVAEIEII